MSSIQDQNPFKSKSLSEYGLYTVRLLMAKFLDGSGVQAKLTEIIKNSENELYIIAPYLKIPDQTKNYIKNIDKKSIIFKIISRKDADLPENDIHFFNELNNAKILVCENLHAKCFLNEKEGIITSMNLHEHSQTHNWEMGVQFSRIQDPEVYKAALNEVKMIVEASKDDVRIRRAPPKVLSTNPVQSQSSHKTVYKPKEAPKKGLFDHVLDSIFGKAYCIRCGTTLEKFDLNKPLCDNCYQQWAKHKNPKYHEKFCHACGSDRTNSPISYEKPVCIDCYKAYYSKPRF